jgi:energy-coupling factor transporter ATP-binding protein EcfA2
VSVLISELSVRYGVGAPVLDNISLEFHSNELSFVAGASGGGKTTLIRCINGLIPHHFLQGTLSGNVTVNGKPVPSLSLSEISKEVGTVMQDPERQMVSAHVMDEIAFGLENLAMPSEEIARRVQMQAERLHISHLLHRGTATLSGGEKQKVALAGILVMEPHTVLLDEPLASLDPASSREAIIWFRELANTGVGVVVAEHRHDYVLEANPDHCVVLERGRVTFDGSARDFPSKQVCVCSPVLPRESDAPTLITFENVQFHYGKDVCALNRVNLRIGRGDIVAVLGANGAGKSTFCRHLIGLHKPSEGRVLIDGRDTQEMTVAQIADYVGYVFQSPGAMLFEESLRREIAFGPKNCGVTTTTVEERVVTAAKAMGLEQRLDDSPFILSFGEQKRASVASILSMHPRVVVLDEPTAGQDSENVLRLMDYLVSLRPLEALIFATHNLDLARTYANRCIVISDGEIVADGEPKSVLADQTLLLKCRLR